MGMYVPPFVKKKGAYGADQTEKGALRAGRSCTFRAEWVHSEKVGVYSKKRGFTATTLIWEYPPPRGEVMGMQNA